MKLLARVRDVAMRRHLAGATIECYQAWIADFLRFCRGGGGGAWLHPRELYARDVEVFLTHLARDRRLSASSQNQATCAIVFLYKQVLVDELGKDHLGRFQAERSRRPVRVPTVLSPGEAQRIIDAVPAGSIARLLVECPLGMG